MNANAARALFERALDGELERDDREAFEGALRADAELREEYAVLESLRQTTRALSQKEALPSVDLLAGVQQKLRARSGGKFYRDRFAERRGLGGLTWMLVLSCLVLLSIASWLVFSLW
jgi:anti-sigma factor RsiW